MLKLNSITVHCTHCDELFDVDCSDYEAETDSEERNMGAQISYCWTCECECPNCQQQGDVEIEAWEYPIGIKDYEEPHSTDDFEVIDSDIDVEEKIDDEDPFDYDSTFQTPQNASTISELEDNNSQETSDGNSLSSCCELNPPTSMHYKQDGSYSTYMLSSYNLGDIQVFINNCMERIYKDYISNLSSGNTFIHGKCDSFFTFEKNDPDEIKYSKHNHQQLYLLRYFYSYLIEYRYLYNQLDLNELKVFSIGCGCFLDLYGLLFAIKEGTYFSYYGIDVEDWQYKDLVSDLTMRSLFEQKTLGTCLADFSKTGLNESLGSFNVFIFPKTIEYMENSNTKEISALAAYVKKTTFKEDVIYLILNGMEQLFQEDIDRLDILKNAFCQIGYKVREESQKPANFSSSFYRLSGLKKFPDEKMDFLKDICSKCSNKGCSSPKKPSKSPILNTNSFNYKIIRLER